MLNESTQQHNHEKNGRGAGIAIVLSCILQRMEVLILVCRRAVVELVGSMWAI